MALTRLMLTPSVKSVAKLILMGTIVPEANVAAGIL